MRAGPRGPGLQVATSGRGGFSRLIMPPTLPQVAGARRWRGGAQLLRGPHAGRALRGCSWRGRAGDSRFVATGPCRRPNRHRDPAGPERARSGRNDDAGACPPDGDRRPRPPRPRARPPANAVTEGAPNPRGFYANGPCRGPNRPPGKRGDARRRAGSRRPPSHGQRPVGAAGGLSPAARRGRPGGRCPARRSRPTRRAGGARWSARRRGAGPAGAACRGRARRGRGRGW